MSAFVCKPLIILQAKKMLLQYHLALTFLLCPSLVLFRRELLDVLTYWLNASSGICSAQSVQLQCSAHECGGTPVGCVAPALPRSSLRMMSGEELSAAKGLLRLSNTRILNAWPGHHRWFDHTIQEPPGATCTLRRLNSTVAFVV